MIRIALFITSLIFISCNTKNNLTNSDVTSNVVSEHSNWESLFDGKTLNNWIIECSQGDRERSYWSVDNGAILANSMGDKEHGYVWLVSDKEFADFELKLKFQSFRDSPGNSGVQIRSRYDKTAKVEGERAEGYMDGPQVDIHPPGSWRTGYIYDETRGHRRWIDPSLPDWRMDRKEFEPESHIHYYSDEAPFWNELKILCKGTHITTIVNGITVSDYDGTGILDDTHHKKINIDKQGHIALQLHKDDEIKIAFKDILIREM